MSGRMKIQLYRISKLLMLLTPKKKYRVSGTLFDNSRYTDRSQWIFHNETWERIEHRFEDRKKIAKNIPVQRNDDPQELTDEVEFLEDGAIRFDGRTKSSEEWLYLHLDPKRYAWNDYRMEFRFKRETGFRELQFGFRYQDFYSRYRYRFENNKIFFDKVIRGRFYNGLSAVPFKMESGKYYKITIDVFGNRFRCLVDDRLMSEDFDIANDFAKGSAAIILWENDSRTDITGTLRAFKVHGLK
jgi:hypothetical protein